MAIERFEVEDLYDRLAPAIYSLALTDTGSQADAEDLVQQTLLAYLEATSAGTVIANPEHWAMRVASNALKRRGRQRRLWKLIERPPEVAAPDDVAVDVVGSLAPAMKALQRLSKDDRQLITLYRLAGRSDSETAEIAGTSAQNVRQRLVRGWNRLAQLYLEELLHKRPKSRACRKPWGLLPRAVAGMLTSSQQEQLGSHLSACEPCRQAHDELEWYWKEGFTALLPLKLPPNTKPRVVGRLVAILAGLTPDPSPPRRKARRRLLLALALLLLVLFFIPGLPAQLTINQPAGLVLAPSPSPTPGEPSSAPLALTAGASPSSATHAASPRPSVLSPCPTTAPAAGYAYLDAGELYYSSQLGASARRLTSTGGHVDAFWWSPDGSRVAYKQTTSADISGDVHVISLGSGTQLWQFGSAVDSFAFSPDGAGYAVANRVVTAGTWSGEDVKVGAVGQPASSATDYQLPHANLPYNPADFQEATAMPQSVFNPLQGLFWTGSLIYFNVPEYYATLDPSSGTVNSGQPDTAPLENAWFGIPSQTRFTLNWNTGDLQRLCAGRAVAESLVTLGGRPDFMSVSAGGGAALLSLNDGGADLVWLQPDGTLTRLSSDGLSAGARWHP